MRKRQYIDVNVPRELEPYLNEALENPIIQKQLELSNCTKTHSGLGTWIIQEFLLENTSYRFRHLNTYKDHVTIIDNKIKRVIQVYVKEILLSLLSWFTNNCPTSLCCILCG